MGSIGFHGIKLIQNIKSQIKVEAHSLLFLVNIWLMGSFMVWPKVIPFSGIHCIYILIILHIVNFLQQIKHFLNYLNLQQFFIPDIHILHSLHSLNLFDIFIRCHYLTCIFYTLYVYEYIYIFIHFYPFLSIFIHFYPFLSIFLCVHFLNYLHFVSFATKLFVLFKLSTFLSIFIH
jgi:hypothetical protein